jgi:DNA mismatch endonuclease, patch repair protein
MPTRKRPPLSRSEVMSRIRSENTTPEIRTRSAAYSMGFRYRTHVRSLPGRPDLANKQDRWVILVHGCFWHCHSRCALASDPRTNRAYWVPKLKENVRRDRRSLKKLEDEGYKVLIIWECETKDQPGLRARLRHFKSYLKRSSTQARVAGRRASYSSE